MQQIRGSVQINAIGKQCKLLLLIACHCMYIPVYWSNPGIGNQSGHDFQLCCQHHMEMTAFLLLESPIHMEFLFLFL